MSDTQENVSRESLFQWNINLPKIFVGLSGVLLLGLCFVFGLSYDAVDSQTARLQRDIVAFNKGSDPKRIVFQPAIAKEAKEEYRAIAYVLNQDHDIHDPAHAMASSTITKEFGGGTGPKINGLVFDLESHNKQLVFTGGPNEPAIFQRRPQLQKLTSEQIQAVESYLPILVHIDRGIRCESLNWDLNQFDVSLPMVATAFLTQLAIYHSRQIGFQKGLERLLKMVFFFNEFTKTCFVSGFNEACEQEMKLSETLLSFIAEDHKPAALKRALKLIQALPIQDIDRVRERIKLRIRLWACQFVGTGTYHRGKFAFTLNQGKINFARRFLSSYMMAGYLSQYERVLEDVEALEKLRGREKANSFYSRFSDRAYLGFYLQFFGNFHELGSWSRNQLFYRACVEVALCAKLIFMKTGRIPESIDQIETASPLKLKAVFEARSSSRLQYKVTNRYIQLHDAAEEFTNSRGPGIVVEIHK